MRMTLKTAGNHLLAVLGVFALSGTAAQATFQCEDSYPLAAGISNVPQLAAKKCPIGYVPCGASGHSGSCHVGSGDDAFLVEWRVSYASESSPQQDQTTCLDCGGGEKKEVLSFAVTGQLNAVYATVYKQVGRLKRACVYQHVNPPLGELYDMPSATGMGFVRVRDLDAAALCVPETANSDDVPVVDLDLGGSVRLCGVEQKCPSKVSGDPIYVDCVDAGGNLVVGECDGEIGISGQQCIENPQPGGESLQDGILEVSTGAQMACVSPDRPLTLNALTKDTQLYDSNSGIKCGNYCAGKRCCLRF